MKIGIIGAGIGGLSAAIGLHRSGADVTVFEQAPHVRSGGSGISLFGNGLRALDAIGVGDPFRAIVSTEAASYRGGLRRPDGSWLATYPPDAVRDLRVVDRTALHEMLHSALPPESIRTGSRVIAASPDADVDWVDPGGQGHRDRFDLVIAADGIGSRIRRSLPDDPGITYAGYSAWRGITEVPVELNHEAGETWGVARRFGIAPLVDGRVYWFAVLSTSRDRPVEDHRGELIENFGSWHDPIPELISRTPAERIHHLPIDELAGHLRSYVRGRLVFVGDAAHAMTPNLGQGGGQTLEDAATLGVLLSELAGSQSPAVTRIEAALRRYDALRLTRTHRIARRSHLIGRLAHVPGSRLTGVRDVVLRATPASALRRQLNRLQDWTPVSPAQA